MSFRNIVDNSENDSTIVRQEPLEAQIYRALQREIVRGLLKGGDRLVQDAVAERLGTSRIPVRDALRRLEHEGLVEMGKRGTYRVREFTAEDVDEVFGLRKLLEPYAVVLAIGRLTASDFEDLDVLQSEMNAACVDDDREHFVELNQSFHFILYERASSARLLRMIEGLWYGMPRTPSRIPGRMQVSLEEHSRILDALRVGDAENCAELTREHIDNACKAAKEYFS